jgi:hypothetical protein
VVALSEALSTATDDYVKTRTDDTEPLTWHEKVVMQFEETTMDLMFHLCAKNAKVTTPSQDNGD